MISRCEKGGDEFGNEFLDYQNIDVEELICYMNMALCGTSNIRFKEKMFYEKLSDAITILEEVFGVLVFENYYKRWLFSLKKELKIVNEEIHDDADSILDSNEIAEEIPNVLYQKNICKKGIK